MVSLLVIRLVDTYSINPYLQPRRPRTVKEGAAKIVQSVPKISGHSLESIVNPDILRILV